MPKIVVLNSSMMEMDALAEIFENEPFFEFYAANDEEKIKYYRELLGDDVSPVLLACGPEINEAAISETRVFFEDLKICWPEAKVFLISFDQSLMDQTEQMLLNKIDEKIDLSKEEESCKKEILKKIKTVAMARKPKQETGKIPGVLVVDDEINILKTLSLFLKTAGFEKIWTAENFEKAVLTFHDYLKNIDVALIDYNLGTEKADRLIKKLKEIGPRVKIFIITGEEVSKKRPWSKETDAIISGVITKPFYNLEEIVTTINDVLQKETILIEKVRKKILVIDDSPETAQLLSEIFANEFLVIEAPDGEQGLKKFEEISPNLVVLDYKLPGKNGLEILKELYGKYPNVKVIVVTIEKNQQITAEFLKEGAIRVFQKPIESDKISEIIREHLR